MGEWGWLVGATGGGVGLVSGGNWGGRDWGWLVGVTRGWGWLVGATGGGGEWGWLVGAIGGVGLVSGGNWGEGLGLVNGCN